MDRVSATYRVETPFPVEETAQKLAGEQSTGTFVAVPGETKERLERFAARVEHIVPQESTRTASLPGCRLKASAECRTDEYYRAEVTISWPVENFGSNLPALVSTLQGNLYELSQLSGLKLLDIDLPDAFLKQFQGSRHGIDGTRRLAGVHDRPLIGTIIKPSVGLSPDETAELVRQLVAAGIDFIKDDELMADPPHSPFDERVAAVMKVIRAHADRTGKKVMYAFNISDEFDAARRHYDLIASSGGSCAMLSLNTMGLAATQRICRHGKLVIHGHRNGWGMLTRHPMLGVEFSAYQKLWRLAGVNQIHVNGIQNKFWESDDSVQQSIESCLAPLGDDKSLVGRFQILPVISSGQWGGQAFETYRRTGTIDLLYLAGGGIMAHPDGIAGGVSALTQAWQAAINGDDLNQAIEKHEELRHSVDKFGSM